MVFLYLIPFAFKYMMSAVESGQVSPACHIPMYYVQAAPLCKFYPGSDPYYPAMVCSN